MHMQVVNYLNDKKNKIESKYGLIHKKTTATFHRETSQRKLVRTNINQLIKKSKISIESIVKAKRKIISPCFLQGSSKNLGNSFKENID